MYRMSLGLKNSNCTQLYYCQNNENKYKDVTESQVFNIYVYSSMCYMACVNERLEYFCDFCEKHFMKNILQPKLML